MNSIRCGVIGYGPSYDMGKSHGDMISNTPGLSLVAVCDSDLSRLQEAERDFPGIETFANHHDLVHMQGLDLVVVVTPHNTHASLAVDCLEEGKHVIVEKPMSLTVSEGRLMILAAQRHRVTLSVFHNRRWDGSHLALKEVVESGEIGEIHQIDAFSGGFAHPGRWWRSDKPVSGGPLFDWGAHFLDWFLDLVPAPVVDVSGYSQKRGWPDVTNEDHALLVMRFENGVVASLEQSSIAAAPKDRLRVLGTKGAAVWKGEGEEFWTVTVADPPEPEAIRKAPFRQRDWSAFYRNLADHFQRGERIEITPEHCLRIVSVIEAADRSSRLGSSVAPEVA